MKKYEFSMHSGNSTKLAILINPEFDNGIVRAIKIGNFVGYDDNGKYVYQKCERQEFIAGGYKEIYNNFLF